MVSYSYKRIYETITNYVLNGDLKRAFRRLSFTISTELSDLYLPEKTRNSQSQPEVWRKIYSQKNVLQDFAFKILAPVFSLILRPINLSSFYPYTVTEFLLNQLSLEDSRGHDRQGSSNRKKYKPIFLVKSWHL